MEFGLYLLEDSVQGADVGKYLHTATIKIIDTAAFPTNDLLHLVRKLLMVRRDARLAIVVEARGDDKNGSALWLLLGREFLVDVDEAMGRALVERNKREELVVRIERERTQRPINWKEIATLQMPQHSRTP